MSDRDDAAAFDFVILADNFLSAAHLLFHNPAAFGSPHSPIAGLSTGHVRPALLLLAHAIEQALKGFLLHAGAVTLAKLKKRYSHGISAAFEDALAHGMAKDDAVLATPASSQMIAELSAVHEEPFLRYPMQSVRQKEWGLQLDLCGPPELLVLSRRIVVASAKGCGVTSLDAFKTPLDEMPPAIAIPMISQLQLGGPPPAAQAEDA